MRKASMLPDLMGDTWQRWPDLPSKVLVSSLPYVLFVPEWVTLRFTLHLEVVASALSLELSQRQGSGTRKLPSGTQINYTWGSTNRKTTDWLQVHVPYDSLRPTEVIRLVEGVIDIKTHEDLSISLLSVDIPRAKSTSPQKLAT
jgi:hypothetical protein